MTLTPDPENQPVDPYAPDNGQHEPEDRDDGDAGKDIDDKDEDDDDEPGATPRR